MADVTDNIAPTNRKSWDTRGPVVQSDNPHPSSLGHNSGTESTSEPHPKAMDLQKPDFTDSVPRLRLSSSNDFQAPALPTRLKQWEISYLGDPSAAVADRVLRPTPNPAPDPSVTPVNLSPSPPSPLPAAHPRNQRVVTQGLCSFCLPCLSGRDLCLPSARESLGS